MIFLSEKARTRIGIPSAENEQGDMTLRARHPVNLLFFSIFTSRRQSTHRP